MVLIRAAVCYSRRPLMLIERDLLPEPLLYLSAYFERHRGAYYDHLLAVSQTGEWEEWLFFLRGVSVEARDASRRVGKLFELRESYRDRFQREDARPNLHVAGGGGHSDAQVQAVYHQTLRRGRGLARARKPAHQAAQERLAGDPGGGIDPYPSLPRHRLQGTGALQETMVDRHRTRCLGDHGSL